ncbi:Rne/Rng family ribonuclease [Catenulispora sp. NF23]|uniref:Rne/Rng family ribonuclease n=1 Tax=Catenulispora pinistramenti TaxID=2705254 RepID=UPI001BACDE83|nr:Rne/Rng family ribonuclease [Catenulispora pinistramenti]MBS2536752.1 Rne/Rng family ribonuclease [Catenulispora pinistramenti]
MATDDDVQGVRGSTRLEAKKQRRREGRDTGRRRAPLITEAEFLARRESVERVMVVRQSGDRTQIGVLEDGVLVEHYVNRAQSASYVGNVYLGKVQNVLPSMEAAFVDIGKGRNAVLYAGEVNFEAAGVTGSAKRIESVLKSGQAVLTQVTKDPIGHKGARLTSQISLPGRYLVYVPEGTMTGISRKLPENERNRLKAILKAVVPEHAGVIVRTAAEGATEDELRRDVERLSAQWEEIQRRAASSASSAPTLLYGEPDLTVRVVRDIFNEDFSKLIVSGDQAWDTIREYVGGVAPDLAPRLERWTSEQDAFAVHRVDEQLAKGLDRKVWLPSGGSLVIDRTEAMVVIDVNTGKFTGSGGNLEETVTRNNIEAAEEIVRQLRLRDLGGIIVIDFIDMVLESNRDLVMRRLLECLGRDRTKHQVAEVTSLGLIQMTRKRVGQGLLEAFSETCDKCNGRGVLVHMEPVPVSHAHLHEDDRDGRNQGRGAKQGGSGQSDGGGEDEHEGGRGRRKRRKSHGHADRQQQFDPQYDVDGVPEEFQDFADGEQAAAGPVTVTKVTKVAADTDREPAEDEATELSEHSEVEQVPSRAHVVAPVLTPADVVAAEEADVTERLAAGDAQAHTVYVPHAGADVSAAGADARETEAEPVAVAVAASGAEADPQPAEDAPKRRGLRVRRAAKRPAGPPTAHS